MSITEQQLRQIMPLAGARLAPHLPYINPALEWGNIVEPLDAAAFIAHLALESGEYRWMEEIADGSAYEGRIDLGNTVPGDGPKFKGHGPIQITGRDAHRACGEALGLDLIADPLLLTRPEHGTHAAVWFWTRYKPACQAAAKVGWFHVTQRLVNGGENGWAERVVYYQRGLQMLKLPAYDPDGEGDAIRAFQAAHPPLVVDGAAGAKTLTALLADIGTPTSAPTVPIISCEEAIRRFQRKRGLTVDAICGEQTQTALGIL